LSSAPGGASDVDDWDENFCSLLRLNSSCSELTAGGEWLELLSGVGALLQQKLLDIVRLQHKAQYTHLVGSTTDVDGEDSVLLFSVWFTTGVVEFAVDVLGSVLSAAGALAPSAGEGGLKDRELQVKIYQKR